MKLDTEDTCHCGASYNGSDHCPECYCEQYETYGCGEPDEFDSDPVPHGATAAEYAAAMLAEGVCPECAYNVERCHCSEEG